MNFFPLCYDIQRSIIAAHGHSVSHLIGNLIGRQVLAGP